MTDLDRLLRDRHRKVQTLMTSLDHAKVDLLEAILSAIQQGYSLQDIANVLGLSKSRVQQLVRQADGRGRSPR